MVTATGRKEVQAGDDEIGDPQDADGQVDSNTVDTMGLSPEEFAQFQEMEANSGPNTQIVQDGADEAALANADAQAALAQAEGAKQQQTEADAQAKADQSAKDQQALADATRQQGDADGDDDETDPTEGGKYPQRVNYHKWRRSEDRRQAAEKRAREAEEKVTRYDERMRMLIDAAGIGKQPAQQQPAQQQVAELGPMPDPKVDIFAFAEWQAQKNVMLEKQLEELSSGVVGTQEAQQSQQLERAYLGDIQRFSAQNADFQQAYHHLLATRLSELAYQLHGVDMTEEGAQLTPEQYRGLATMIENEERQLASAALSRNISPAQQIYTMAKARGYRKAAAPAAGANGQQQNGSGQAKPANGNGAAAPGNGAPASQQRSKVSEAVAAAKRGVETNQTLSSGGGAPEGQLTAQQVLSMSQTDFDRWYATATPEQIEAILGH